MSPDIRFANFNQPWTVTELGEISTKVTEKNNDNSCQLIFTNSAEYGIIAQSEFFDRDIANADNIYSYYKVRPNMFVYNPRISVTAPVGPVNRNKSNLIGVMSPLYYVFEVRNIDYGFLEYMFKSNVWHRFMYMNGNSGARSDRFSISDKLFSKLPICHPKQEEEQQKIAEMLSLLDEDISNNALRLLKTRQIKQSLLKKMFA